MPIKSDETNMVQAINMAIDQEMKRDKSVIVLGEDVGVDGGVFRVTQGLLEKYGKMRVIDTPLAESVILGSSVGMGIYGLRPIAEIQFSGFIYSGFNQIINHISRIRSRTRGKHSCPMVIRAPFCGGIRALEHHSESMEAIYSHIPGLKVVIPSDPYDAKGLMASAIRDNDPVLFLEPKRVYRMIKQKVPKKEYTLPIGKANVVKKGNELTVISYGAMFWYTKKVLEETEIDYELIDLRTISPLDTKTIIESVKKTGKCVIVNEAPKSFNVASEIIALINDHALLHLKAPVKRVTGFDVHFPLYKNENNYLPNANRILKAINDTIEY